VFFFFFLNAMIVSQSENNLQADSAH